MSTPFPARTLCLSPVPANSLFSRHSEKSPYRFGLTVDIDTGIPLTHKHVEASGVLSDAIYLFREGLLAMATNDAGEVDEDELRRQIRITLLHELGHYHGLDEAELEELGY